jgi:hypothetical protein
MSARLCRLTTNLGRLFVALSILSGGIMTPVYATTIFSSSGTSAKGVAVKFVAEMTISGDSLTVVLKNDSPVDSLNPDDLLGSFYWDIVNGSNMRPTLTYVSATGDVYLGDKNDPDTLQTSAANLKAVNNGDNSWQFKVMNPALSPFGGFGLGTVGNSAVAPNNFMGSIVGTIDYSIYKGEITTANLNNKLLVRGPATFLFTGVAGFTEADIVPTGTFGLGTAPDSFITSTVPEPGSLLLVTIGLASVVGCSWRRRTVA